MIPCPKRERKPARSVSVPYALSLGAASQLAVIPAERMIFPHFS
jgi:hypothetical protein